MRRAKAGVWLLLITPLLASEQQPSSSKLPLVRIFYDADINGFNGNNVIACTTAAGWRALPESYPKNP